MKSSFQPYIACLKNPHQCQNCFPIEFPQVRICKTMPLYYSKDLTYHFRKESIYLLMPIDFFLILFLPSRHVSVILEKVDFIFNLCIHAVIVFIKSKANCKALLRMSLSFSRAQKRDISWITWVITANGVSEEDIQFMEDRKFNWHWK